MALIDGRYEIEGEIGRDAGGIVFRAIDTQYNQEVAIKQLGEPEEMDEIRERVEVHWDSIHALDHPNIIKTYAYGLDITGFYLVLEYAAGISLQQRLITEGKLPVKEGLELFRGIVSALAYAHEQNLLHLNIEPANIFLVKVGANTIAKVANFSLWQSGDKATPPEADSSAAFFQAPELRRKSYIGKACDVYAAGKLLYVMVTGETASRVSPEAIPPDPMLQELIYKCIRTNRSDRYQSMDEILALLPSGGGEAIPASRKDKPAAAAVLDATPAMEGRYQSRLPKETAEPVAPHALDTVELSMKGLNVGQVRVTAGLKNRLKACERHLRERRLNSAREMMGDIGKLLSGSPPPQDGAKPDSGLELFEQLEQDLSAREAELAELVESAREALENHWLKDCLLYCANAEELSVERTGCEQFRERANQMLTNINIFWEGALQAFNQGLYEKSSLACMKILELQPNHAEALALRARLLGSRRQKKIAKALLWVLPVLLVLSLAIGGLSYWLWQYRKRCKDFEEYRKAGNAAKASEIAGYIRNRYEPAKIFHEERQQAGDSLAAMADERDKINAKQVVTLAAAKGLWEEAEAAKTAATEAYGTGDNRKSIPLADKAAGHYRDLQVQLLIVYKVLPLMAKDEWRQALKLVKEALKINPKVEKVRQLQEQIKLRLIPELRIITLVKGDEVKGAKIYLNGKLVKEQTPDPILLRTRRFYKIKVVLAPRHTRYYVPYETIYKFEHDEAKTIRVELEVVEGPGKGKTWTLPELGMNFAPIEPGNFRMGVEDGPLDARPVRSVQLSKNFWMGVHEVSQEEYYLVTKRNPSRGRKTRRCPVNTISWAEARDFCRRLSRREKAAHRLPKGYSYRLPTEAEWEYCCRAKTPPGELTVDAHAWHANNVGEDKYREVGAKEANPWGLHDMLGSVAEWCRDWYTTAAYSRKARKDPLGPSRGKNKVVRGGSRISPPEECRSYLRSKLPPKTRNPHLGFRVALAPVISN